MSPTHERTRSIQAGIVVAAGLIAVGCAHLYPLSLSPGVTSAGQSPDMQELIWRLLWGAHAIVTPGVTLLDANTFFPEDGTYTTMDYAVGMSLIAIPIRAFVDNPLLAYNLTCLASLAIGAVGTYLLTHRLTGHRGAAAVAAAMFAFNPIRLGRLGQANILGVHWLPFLLLGAHALFERPGRGKALALAAGLLLAVLTGGYQAVFAAGVLGWATIVLAAAAPRRAARPVVLTGVAIALAGASFLPVGKPYVDEASVRNRVRTLGDVRRGSPKPADLLFSSSVAHERIRSILDPDDSLAENASAVLMPGLVAWTIAAAGLGALITRRRWALATLYGGLTIGGFAFSLGLNLPGYQQLYELLPPLKMIRAPSRFALVGLLGLAVLAAFGIAGISRWMSVSRPRAAALLAPALALAHLVEVYRPVGVEGYRYDPPPAVYTWLAAQPGEFGVVELPTVWDLNMFYLVYSTYHWKPIVNGYNGSFLSPYHDRLLFRTLNRFPEPAALEALREIVGLRYVVLHYDPDETKMRRHGRWHARQQIAKALEDVPEGFEEVWRDEHSAVLEIVEPDDGFSVQWVRRVTGRKALEGKRLRFEARRGTSPLPLAGWGVRTVLNGTVLETAPIMTEFRTIEIALPDEDVPRHGINEITLENAYRFAPGDLPWEFDLTIGETGTRLDAWVVVRSAGPRWDQLHPGEGNKASIFVNGREVSQRQRGYNAVWIDPADGQILASMRFDTWRSREEADLMAGWIDALEPGSVVVLASRDQASRNLTDAAVRALAALGSRLDPREAPADSHAMIGVKGASSGQASERAHWKNSAKLVHGDRRMLPSFQVRDIELVDGSESPG